VTIARAGEAISTIAMTTSGRIATTEVVVITTTNAKRNRRTGPLLIAAQQGVQAMLGARAKEQAHLQGVLQNPKNNKHQVQDKKRQYKAHYNDVTMQVTMTSCAVALIHWSQVRTRRQPPARAKKPMRMRVIIFILMKK
jgi:hypothetical protein